jgi:hypothetical protein
VAESYFADGSIEMACPPLKALLHIMARGSYEERDINHPAFRALFNRDSVVQSAWYQRRLEARQRHDVKLWRAHAAYLENFLKKKNYAEEAQRLGIPARLETAWAMCHKVKTGEYLASLQGAIGRQPLAEENESEKRGLTM